MLICLHTVKWFHIFISNTDSFIFTQLNGSKYCYIKTLDRSSDVPKRVWVQYPVKAVENFQRRKLTGDNDNWHPLNMARGTRTVYPGERTEGLSSTFQPPEEGWSIQRPTRCDKHGDKHEDNSPKNLNNVHKTSSQKYRQEKKLSFRYCWNDLW